MDRYSPAVVRACDGLKLVVHRWGPPEHPPVLFLHGGGQTGWAWERTARVLARRGFHCLAADLRGHGDSQWAGPDRYSLDHFAGDVRSIVGELCRVPPVTVGASLGGLSALAAEGESPESWFSALALVDITPRFEERGVSRILDFLHAHPEGFESLEAAARAVSAYLPHRSRQSTPSGIARNLRERDGRWYWHWDPSMLRSARQAVEQWPERVSAAARRLTIDTLLVSGGLSDVVSGRTIAEFLELVPHAEHVRIDDAAHMIAGDSNDRFSSTVLDFLARRQGRKSA